jgi:hypothetical protein
MRKNTVQYNKGKGEGVTGPLVIQHETSDVIFGWGVWSGLTNIGTNGVSSLQNYLYYYGQYLL